MAHIVTSICVDVDALGHTSVYPALHGSNESRRDLYWRCVASFCLTALRFHPEQQLVVYTNDQADVLLGAYPLRRRLQELGMQIIHLPFTRFDPGQHSRLFRNAFYKLEVLEAMAALPGPSLLLDSDCIWSRRDERLFALLEAGEQLLLQDTYQRSATPLMPEPHGLSMQAMGDLFATIPLFPSRTPHPVWYGGELIGGTPAHFRLVAERLQATFRYGLERIEAGQPLCFANGRGLFDGMEAISSYVYNTLESVPILDTYGLFSKRLWTGRHPNNVEPGDLQLPIWHLPGEKVSGLRELFYAIIDPSAPFWHDPAPQAAWLGQLVGIPRRPVPLAERLQEKRRETMAAIKRPVKALLRR